MSGDTTLGGSLFATVYFIFGVHNDNELIYRMGCCAALYTSVVGIYCAFQPAPYGKFSKSWTGTTINAKFGWMIQESPAWIVPIILMYQSPWVWKMNVQNTLLTILFISHYVQRSLLYPLRIREAARPAPLLTVSCAFLFCLYNGLFQCHHLMNVEEVKNFILFIPGVTMFLVGMFINVHHDGILLALKKSRTEGDRNEYKIPRGALFEFVSGANYLGEIVEWCGFAMASGKIPQVQKHLKLTSFSWKDCGSGSESIQLKSLSVSPDPIGIPGLLSLGFNVMNAKDLNSPVSLSTVVKKKVFGVWIKIPCEDNVGSCDFSDACSVIPPTCPESFIKYKIPCKCPIKSGNFIMPLSPVLNITGAGIPKWLEGGSYEVKVTLKDKSGTEVACVDVQAKLKAK